MGVRRRAPQAPALLSSIRVSLGQLTLFPKASKACRRLDGKAAGRKDNGGSVGRKNLILEIGQEPSHLGPASLGAKVCKNLRIFGSITSRQ